MWFLFYRYMCDFCYFVPAFGSKKWYKMLIYIMNIHMPYNLQNYCPNSEWPLHYQERHPKPDQFRFRPNMTSKHEHDQPHTSSKIINPCVCHQFPNGQHPQTIMTVMKNRSGQQFSMMSKRLHQIPCNQDPTMIKFVSHQTSHVEIQIDQDRHYITYKQPTS